MADLEGNSWWFWEETHNTLEVNSFFIRENGEESLGKFLSRLNTFHPTIEFTAEYSKETINFLDANIRLAGRKGGAHDRFVY